MTTRKKGFKNDARRRKGFLMLAEKGGLGGGGGGGSHKRFDGIERRVHVRPGHKRKERILRKQNLINSGRDAQTTRLG